jgi:hypothetical protein
MMISAVERNCLRVGRPLVYQVKSMTKGTPMRSAPALLLLAAALACGWTAAADARQRPQRPLLNSHSSARTLTIPKRSYLDAGVVVAPGSLPNYATQMRMQAPIYSYDDRFTDPIPSPWFMPGRPQPLFQFETPGQ